MYKYEKLNVIQWIPTLQNKMTWVTWWQENTKEYNDVKNMYASNKKYICKEKRNNFRKMIILSVANETVATDVFHSFCQVMGNTV